MNTNYFAHDSVYRRLRGEGAAGWDRSESAYAEQRLRFQRMLAKGHAPRAGRLLELGCGAGNMSIYLASLGYEVTGIDISPTAIDWACERREAQSNFPVFLVADALQLEHIPAAEFDFVLDGHCFHCIIGEDRQRFLGNAFRMLKPGAFMLMDAMCDAGRETVIPGYDPKTQCVFSNGIAIRYIGAPEAIAEEVLSAGFHVIDVEADTGEDTGDGVGNIVIQARKPLA